MSPQPAPEGGAFDWLANENAWRNFFMNRCAYERSKRIYHSTLPAVVRNDLICDVADNELQIPASTLFLMLEVGVV